MKFLKNLWASLFSDQTALEIEAYLNQAENSSDLEYRQRQVQARMRRSFPA